MSSYLILKRLDRLQQSVNAMRDDMTELALKIETNTASVASLFEKVESLAADQGFIPIDKEIECDGCDQAYYESEMENLAGHCPECGEALE